MAGEGKEIPVARHMQVKLEDPHRDLLNRRETHVLCVQLGLMSLSLGLVGFHWFGVQGH